MGVKKLADPAKATAIKNGMGLMPSMVEVEIASGANKATVAELERMPVSNVVIR